MAFLIFRYIYIVKSYKQQTMEASRRIFYGLTFQTPLNIDLHRGKNFGGPTSLPNLVFLGAIGANRKGGRIDPPPPLPGRVMKNAVPGRGLITFV